jgi:antitoxin ParD1/3/4
MNVSLTPELEKYVQEKVSSGLYTSASEVIRESLRLMHTYEDVQQQRVQELNQTIDLGLQQLAQGKMVTAKASYGRLKNKIQTIANKKLRDSK